MEQTFHDLWNEKQTKKETIGFVFWMFMETTAGIIHEHGLRMNQGGIMSMLATHPRSAAFIGLLFLTPFLFLNAVVGSRIEPFFSMIRPGAHTSTFEYILLFSVLLLIPIGSLIAIRPMLQKGSKGKRKFYWANAILAAVLFAFFILLFTTLGTEIYRCNILLIPNCD